MGTHNLEKGLTQIWICKILSEKGRTNVDRAEFTTRRGDVSDRENEGSTVAGLLDGGTGMKLGQV